MSKLKTFHLHWTAEVHGIQTVEAFDLADAEEQFNSMQYIDDMDDAPINAELDYAIKAKKKSK